MLGVTRTKTNKPKQSNTNQMKTKAVETLKHFCILPLIQSTVVGDSPQGQLAQKPISVRWCKSMLELFETDLAKSGSGNTSRPNCKCMLLTAIEITDWDSCK